MHVHEAWCLSEGYEIVNEYIILPIADMFFQAKVVAGSLLNMAWSADGTVLACAGASGVVAFARVVEMTLEDEQTRVTIGSHDVHVVDLNNEVGEELEFRDRVVKASLGLFTHIVRLAMLRWSCMSIVIRRGVMLSSLSMLFASSGISNDFDSQTHLHLHLWLCSQSFVWVR